MGITLLPAFAVAHDLEAGTLVARPVDNALFQRSQAHMVTRVGRQQPKASILLLRHLQRWMQAFRDPASASDQPTPLPDALRHRVFAQAIQTAGATKPAIAKAAER